MHTACRTYVILFGLLTLTVVSEEWKIWCSLSYFLLLISLYLRLCAEYSPLQRPVLLYVRQKQIFFIRLSLNQFNPAYLLTTYVLNINFNASFPFLNKSHRWSLPMFFNSTFTEGGNMLQALKSRVRLPMMLDFFNLPNPSSCIMGLG
jgi:hypothetical protein